MNRQTPWHHPKRWGSAVVVWALMAQMVVPAHAFVSQLPGVYTTPPDVNVMFTLDDSGSMYSEAIPDFPQNVAGMLGDDASGALGGLGATNNFGTQFPALWYEGRNRRGVVVARSGYFEIEYYKKANSVARFLRSSAGNPLYYDPNVTYLPWPTAADDSVLHPDANPSAVNIHPADPFNSTRAIDIVLRRGAAGADDEAANFWPATYFKYKGPAPLTIAEIDGSGNNVAANFDKIEIKSAALTPTFNRRTKTQADGTVVVDDDRTDCGTGTSTCPYAAEIQNFANWLQYYHSRLLMAKGGVAAAFARQGTNLRVGFGTINSANVVRRGIAPFSGTNRTAFYNEMYPRVNAGGTPLREAMDKVGIYFKRFDVGNPWAEDPTSGVIGTEHACRRSFHILSTDGFWNGNSANSDISGNNIDNFTGKKTPPRPLATVGEDFSDAPTSTSKFGISPFADPTLDTLSDVAAYYWLEDLRTLSNTVIPTNQDPAFWQHLATYTIGLGITGTGKVMRTSDGSKTVPMGLPSTDPLFKFQGKPWLEEQFVRDWLITNKVPMTWPAAVANAAETGDDLVRASMVGRGKYFSATNPKDLANGLAATLAEAANQPLDFASLAVDSAQVISGGKAYQATFSPSGWYGRLYAFNQAADGTFSNTPSTLSTLNPDQAWEASNKMPKPADRAIYTSDGGVGSGKPFLWDNLTPAQKGYLAGDKALLEFLRGDGSNELANGGNFRDRSRYALGTTAGGVLGDVVGGSPLKGPDAGGGYDRLPTTTGSGQASYATFRSASGPLEDMRDTVFLGANDGMLHAFNFSTGSERFAFVPSTVYNVPRSTSGGLAEQKLRMLSEPGYTHRFTVDGPPNVADAYFANAWHSVLVGSTGAGARGVFVMDVTKPEPGTSGFGSSKLLWELTEADAAGVNMGFVLAYPHVVRMRNDKWAVIFGNGYDSKDGKAVLYIRDAETGVKIQEFEVDASGSNGLSQPNFVLNASREVIAIYAGDLKGNLWKFDVSDANENNWASPFGPTTPLFKATGPSGNVQPISVMPEISAHPNGGAVITFGTGKLFETSDTATGASNVNLSTQSIYGVWDKPLETTPVGMTAANRSTRLLQQTVLPVVAGDLTNGRRSSLTVPDWGSQRGWFLDLESVGERSNLPPQQFRNIVFVATNTPAISDPCASGGSSKIFALDPVTGAAPTYAVFDLNLNRNFDAVEKGLNVLLNGSALLTQPVFQVFASPGTSASTGPTTQPVAAFDRGQATAARSGGVELSRANGGKSSATGSSTSDDVCKALMSVAQSNTTLLQMRVNGCPLGKPRVSWRQLK